MAARLEATAVLKPHKAGSSAVLWVIAAVLGLAVVAALAAVFLIPRQAVLTVRVNDAQGANVQRVDIFVDGKKHCETSPCTIDKVGAGSRQIKVLSADGLSAERTVQMEGGKNRSETFDLSKPVKVVATGVRVGGTQPGVRLFVDGKEIGQVPREALGLTPGSHRIRLDGGDRYEPIEKEVVIVENEVVDLGQLALRVKKVRVTFQLATAGARVFLVSGADKRDLSDQKFPFAIDLDTKQSWSVEATKAGFADFKQSVLFDDGQPEKSFTIDLSAKPIAAVDAGPPVATTAPTASATATATTPPTTAPTPTPTPTPTAPPTEAFLNINSIPPSMAYLDNRLLGPTPRIKVQVTPGSHVVKFEFSGPDGPTVRTIPVSVGPGETKWAVVKLN